MYLWLRPLFCVSVRVLRASRPSPSSHIQSQPFISSQPSSHFHLSKWPFHAPRAPVPPPSPIPHAIPEAPLSIPPQVYIHSTGHLHLPPAQLQTRQRPPLTGSLQEAPSWASCFQILKKQKVIPRMPLAYPKASRLSTALKKKHKTSDLAPRVWYDLVPHTSPELPRRHSPPPPSPSPHPQHTPAPRLAVSLLNTSFSPSHSFALPPP